ncbi:MAG: type II secretion system protein [Candidatus Saccharibacteria bacterium]|nr:type II secretion system protein [Candidatus Saccharibacteria bacterium]
MKKQKGFTIIEVGLVLAIAGLIFMITFMVLPGLWVSQRDSDRESDVLNFVQTLKNFQTNNNRGALPNLTSSEKQLLSNGGVIEVNKQGPSGNSWYEFYRDYLDDSFVDPSGGDYELNIANCIDANHDGICDITAGLSSTKFPNEYKMYVVIGSTCGTENAVYSSNIRRVSVLYKKEGGGVYCANT